MEAFSDDLTCIGDENKCGRFFVFDKITEPDSLRAVQCREDDVFVFPENAPCAWQTVALRFNSCTIKSQIGFGLSHTTLKYLERLKLSIKVSIINERIASPRNEYSPVAMSNMKQPATVISTSVIKRACPISTLEYFSGSWQ